MPRRLIDSRLCGSDKFNTLTGDLERLLYIMLLINADAFGREEASPGRIKAMCFPLRDIKPERIEKAMNELHSAALCIWYDIDGKKYYQITRWDDFQCFNSKNRRYTSKFPMHSAAQCSTVRHCDNSDSDSDSDSEIKDNPSCPKFEDRHLELARHLSRLILKHCPKNITIKKSQGPQWANIFRLMETNDGPEGKGIPMDEIRAVIDWTFTDEFWCSQIQSAGAVRKHWNKLVTKMNKPTFSRQEPDTYYDNLEKF